MGLTRLHIRHARRTLAVAVATACLLGGTTLAAAQTGDLEQERDAVRDQQDRLAGELDVLLATDDEIDAALDELDERIAAQEQARQDALAVADAAARAAAEAEAALRSAERDVEILQDAIREMAVAAYVHPPSADLVRSLQAASLSEALLQKTYLDVRAQRDVDLLGVLETAEAEAGKRAVEAERAARVADDAVRTADAALVALEDERRAQAAFAAGLQDRIDAALAESAALADLDAQLSADIAREQAELIARLPPPTTLPPTTTTTTTLPPTTVTTTTLASEPLDDPVDDPDGEADEPDPGAPDDGAPDDASDDDDSGEDTSDEEALERNRTPEPPLRTVHGITVHEGIADDVDAMLTAALADGIDLGGSGYRSTERQIELRIANCGPTDYDIWERPASTCSPPTAKPGRSLHEQGRAIDFTYNGRLITSRSNDGYAWLAEHAADYGLFNLPSEPWHWSTTGG